MQCLTDSLSIVFITLDNYCTQVECYDDIQYKIYIRWAFLLPFIIIFNYFTSGFGAIFSIICIINYLLHFYLNSSTNNFILDVRHCEGAGHLYFTS